MQTLKETNVKYTTKINSNGDKTVNIKSSNGANVTNVYDGHTNEFKYCYDHNSERVKTYQRDGNIYKYYDGNDNDKPRYEYKRNYDYYDDDKSRYNYKRSYSNGYSKSYNPKRYYK